MSRFLIVTWDGAGNLVPTLGLARRLSSRGHDVRVLGHRAIDERCGRNGWRFRPLRHTRDFDSCLRSPQDDMAAMARELWFDDGVCRDVLDELSIEPADVLVSDCLLMGGLTAGQASRVPTVALFHGAFTLFRQGRCSTCSQTTCHN